MSNSFEVTYSAGGNIDKVKVIQNILGGLINEVQKVDNIPQLDKLIDIYNELNTIDGDVKTINPLLDTIISNIGDIVSTMDKTLLKLDHVNVDDVKVVDEVKMVDEIGKIKNFPTLTQPFNEMVKLSIPAIAGEYDLSYTTPNKIVEILSMTVNCSGYGEDDYYDIFCNGTQWFKNWYLSEVKEGLYLGASTYVYSAAPSSYIELHFNNVSATAKTLWFGIRMLT